MKLITFLFLFLFINPIFSQYAEFQAVKDRETITVVIKSFSDLDEPINIYAHDSVGSVFVQVYIIRDNSITLKPLAGYNGLANVVNYMPEPLDFPSNLVPLGGVNIGVGDYRVSMGELKRKNLPSIFVYELNGIKYKHIFNVTLILK